MTFFIPKAEGRNLTLLLTNNSFSKLRNESSDNVRGFFYVHEISRGLISAKSIGERENH